MSLSTAKNASRKNKRTEDELAALAEDTLRSLDSWVIPVDPFRIAKEEGIELQPGTYSPKFDGRIRYIPEADTFALAYRDFESVRSTGRVRFTVAHELGHYYLHRDYLLRGQCHSSVTNFRSNDVMEQEADEFAANLLMPKDLFRKAVKRFRAKVCDLADLCRLADEKLQTSLTSTARRYCQADIEACSVVFSEGGVVKWAVHSEDMKNHGLGFIQFGTAISPESVTGKLESGSGIAKGTVDPELWYGRNRYRSDLWEESMHLGRTGMTLTLLTPEDSI